MHRVFVYGTLKRGQPNYHLLEKATSGQCEFKGEGSTVSTFPLIIASSYNIPFVLNAPNAEKAQNVRGEVYDVDDEMFSKLDELESHPYFYTRIIVDIRLDGNERVETEKPEDIVKCWLYVLPDFHPDLLQLPFLVSYDSNGSHGQGFIRPSSRNDEVARLLWKAVKKSDQQMPK